jgi:hypothetical protein
MTLEAAARAVLVAHDRVRATLEFGAARNATPEDLAVALVALDSAIDVLRRLLSGEQRCECGHLRYAHYSDGERYGPPSHLLGAISLSYCVDGCACQAFRPAV